MSQGRDRTAHCSLSIFVRGSGEGPATQGFASHGPAVIRDRWPTGRIRRLSTGEAACQYPPGGTLMPVLVRPAKAEDAPVILTFVRELAAFEDAEDKVENTEAAIL